MYCTFLCSRMASMDECTFTRQDFLLSKCNFHFLCIFLSLSAPLVAYLFTVAIRGLLNLLLCSRRLASRPFGAFCWKGKPAVPRTTLFSSCEPEKSKLVNLQFKTEKGTDWPVMPFFVFFWFGFCVIYFFSSLQFVHAIGKSLIVPPLRSVLVTNKEGKKKNPHSVQKTSRNCVYLQQLLLHNLVIQKLLQISSAVTGGKITGHLQHPIESAYYSKIPMNKACIRM